MATHSIEVIDSHTGGEPTRVVIAGGPDLGTGPLAERRERFRREFDRFRSAVVNEPRGSDVVVGALLVPPEDASCAAGVIFFNNVGYLGMCGHGTIGLVATLAHLGRIDAGAHRIETPVGTVTATLHPDGDVSVANVAELARRESGDRGRARHRRGHRRRGVGRQLVLPDRGPRAGSRAGQCGPADGLLLAGAAGAQRARLPGRRSRRALRPAGRADGEFAELRAVPGQGVRSLALRHRHQREARLPRRRRQARRRRRVGPGEHHRQHVRAARSAGSIARRAGSSR